MAKFAFKDADGAVNTIECQGVLFTIRSEGIVIAQFHNSKDHVLDESEVIWWVYNPAWVKRVSE